MLSVGRCLSCAFSPIGFDQMSANRSGCRKRRCLSLFRIDLLFKGADVALYPLYGRLESLLSCQPLSNCLVLSPRCLRPEQLRIRRAPNRGMTYVNVFGEELVGNAVFVNDIVVHACAGRGRTEEEAEESVSC